MRRYGYRLITVAVYGACLGVLLNCTQTLVPRVALLGGMLLGVDSCWAFVQACRLDGRG